MTAALGSGKRRAAELDASSSSAAETMKIQKKSYQFSNKNNTTNTKNIAQTRQEQKQLRKQRKAEKAPVAYERISAMKTLWEKVRLKRLPKAERKGFVKQAMQLAKGNIAELLFKHDSSRMVQSLLKYSDASSDRVLVLTELQGHFVELAQAPYGRFVVLKALKYAPNAAWRSKIIAEFCGMCAGNVAGKPTSTKTPITKLIRHKYADVIVDTIYCVYANAKERQTMVEYFYGTEYLILKQSVSVTSGSQSSRVTLQAVLEAFPEKKERILAQLKDRLLAMVGKEGTIGRNEILHRVLHELVLNVNLAELQELIVAPTAPFHSLLAQLPTVVHTRPGSQLAMIVLAALNAKERKAVLKSWKPHVVAMASNEFGWMVLARVLDCVDDTVLVKSCVWNELLGNTDEDTMACQQLLESHSARRLLLYLLAGPSTKYFSPDLLAALHVRSEFLQQTSKKDAQVRRKELLAIVVPRLVACVEGFPKLMDTLLREMSGAQLVLELLKLNPIAERDGVAKSVVSLLQGVQVWQQEEKSEEMDGESSPIADNMDMDSEESEEEEEVEMEEAEEAEKENQMDVDQPKPLAISKHYLASKESEKPAIRTSILLDNIGARFCKKFLEEIDGFAELVASTVLEHNVVGQLASISAEVLPAGPYFFLVNTLQLVKGAQADALKKTIQEHFLPQMEGTTTANKGLAFLHKRILEQEQKQ